MIHLIHLIHLMRPRKPISESPKLNFKHQNDHRCKGILRIRLENAAPQKVAIKGQGSSFFPAECVIFFPYFPIKTQKNKTRHQNERLHWIREHRKPLVVFLRFSGVDLDLKRRQLFGCFGMAGCQHCLRAYCEKKSEKPEVAIING